MYSTGYDLVVLKSFYGHPNFLRRFGVPADTEIGYVIPAAWQSGMSNGAAAGGILGLLVSWLRQSELRCNATLHNLAQRLGDRPIRSQEDDGRCARLSYRFHLHHGLCQLAHYARHCSSPRWVSLGCFRKSTR